jgi:hypothetical protein
MGRGKRRRGVGVVPPTKQLNERMAFVRAQSSAPRFTPFDVLDLRALTENVFTAGIPDSVKTSDALVHLRKQIKRLDDWPTEHLPRWTLEDVEAVETLVGYHTKFPTTSGRFLEMKKTGGSFRGVRHEK